MLDIVAATAITSGGETNVNTLSDGGFLFLKKQSEFEFELEFSESPEFEVPPPQPRVAIWLFVCRKDPEKIRRKIIKMKINVPLFIFSVSGVNI
jgi:hypothetical protein